MGIGIENTIKPRLQALNASIALLSFLVGTSKAGLSEACNGISGLSRDTALRVDAVLNDLEQMAQDYLPARLDFRDARATEELLNEWRDKKARDARPKTIMEIDREIVAEIFCGADPITLAQRLNISVAELSTRIEAASTRLQSQIDSVRAAAL
jgi:plasmid maintenance system antidote protein VapI